jgi:hypothetical protein
VIRAAQAHEACRERGQSSSAVERGDASSAAYARLPDRRLLYMCRDTNIISVLVLYRCPDTSLNRVAGDRQLRLLFMYTRIYVS